MELDLGNLDGIRNYYALITTKKNLIYFLQMTIFVTMKELQE